MLNVAQSMGGLTSKEVQFTQVPVILDPNDANRVLWQQPQAAQLFSGIRAAAVAPSSSPSAPSSGVSNVTKTFGGITGNTNICSDSGAFTGPDVPADFAP